MTALNHTHDPAARSWVASANTPGTDFPIQNLPLAVFRHYQEDEAFRGGVAIGDQVIDLARVVWWAASKVWPQKPPWLAPTTTSTC